VARRLLLDRSTHPYKRCGIYHLTEHLPVEWSPICLKSISFRPRRLSLDRSVHSCRRCGICHLVEAPRVKQSSIGQRSICLQPHRLSLDRSKRSCNHRSRYQLIKKSNQQPPTKPHPQKPTHTSERRITTTFQILPYVVIAASSFVRISHIKPHHRFPFRSITHQNKPSLKRQKTVQKQYHLFNNDHKQHNTTPHHPTTHIPAKSKRQRSRHSSKRAIALPIRAVFGLPGSIEHGT
jgi:hypothetical protein